MPSVCELSEAREEEDEGKERGYWNDPHGWGADGKYKLKNVLFVNMRDKVLLYLNPNLLDNRMLLGRVVFLQSSQVLTPQLGPKLFVVPLKYKNTSKLKICWGRWKPRAKTWSYNESVSCESDQNKTLDRFVPWDEKHGPKSSTSLNIWIEFEYFCCLFPQVYERLIKLLLVLTSKC